MGIRSEVAIAIKNDAYKLLSDKTKDTIREWFGDYKDRNEEGLLFFADHVKWYHDVYPELNSLYRDFSDKLDENDFMLIKATSEYPEENDGDAGEWYDNPWYVEKQVTVEVYWEGKY